MLMALDVLREHYAEARISQERSSIDGHYLSQLRWVEKPGWTLEYDDAVRIAELNIHNGKMRMSGFIDGREATVDVPTKLIGFICADSGVDVIAIIVQHHIKDEIQAGAVLRQFDDPEWQLMHVLERTDLAIRKRIDEAKREDRFVDARQQQELRALARVSSERAKTTPVVWNIGANMRGWTKESLDRVIDKELAKAKSIKLLDVKLLGYWQTHPSESGKKHVIADYMDAVISAKIPDGYQGLRGVAELCDIELADEENDEDMLKWIGEETEQNIEKISRNQTYFSHNGSYALGQFHRVDK